MCCYCLEWNHGTCDKLSAAAEDLLDRIESVAASEPDAIIAEVEKIAQRFDTPADPETPSAELVRRGFVQYLLIWAREHPEQLPAIRVTAARLGIALSPSGLDAVICR